MEEMAASSSRWCGDPALVSAAGFSAVFGGITFSFQSPMLLV
jgi:hypothetical protein